MRKYVGSFIALLGAAYCEYMLWSWGSGAGMCSGGGCRALSDPAMWMVGALFCMALFFTGWSRRFRRLHAALTLGGIAVECCLVLYQVILGIYCPYCLGFAVLFALYVAFAEPIPLAVRTAGFSSAFGLAIVSSCLLLAFSYFSNFSDIPRLSRVASSGGLALVYEPTCERCEQVIQELDFNAEVSLCPRAWSLSSAWRILSRRCDGILDCIADFAAIRENNRYCAELDVGVPALVADGAVYTGDELYRRVFQDAFSDLFTGGMCRAGTACN